MDLGAKLRGTLSLLIGGLLKKLNVFEQHCLTSVVPCQVSHSFPDQYLIGSQFHLNSTKEWIFRVLNVFT